jgi:hypothetical protein
MNDGTTLAAKVTAASSAEWVRSYTSNVSATLASWSPATDSTCASHSARNSPIAKTAPNVAPDAAVSEPGAPSVDCLCALASGLMAIPPCARLVLNREGTDRRAGRDYVKRYRHRSPSPRLLSSTNQ